MPRRLLAIAAAASAARRLGIVEQVRWLKRCVAPLVGFLEVSVDDVALRGRAEHWELLDQVRRGIFEPQTRNAMRAILRPGDTMLDIGAHIGHYTLLASQLVGRTGRVIAVEPDSETRAILHDNLARNKAANVTVEVRAVSARAGHAMWYRHAVDSSQSSLAPLAVVRDIMEVETVPIDTITAGRPVRLIKLDIEGSEPEALRGMTATLAVSPELVLLVEINPSALARAGSCKETLCEAIAGQGFRSEPLDAHLSPDGSLIAWNLLCRRVETP